MPNLPVAIATAAWAAGLFDGEGCIRISRQHNGKRGTTHYVLDAEVKMCDETPIRELKALFGGTIHDDGSKLSKGGRRIWGWRVVAFEDIIFFLQTIQPYLRVKDYQVRLALEATKHWGLWNVTPEVQAWRDLYYRLLMEAKKP